MAGDMLIYSVVTLVVFSVCFLTLTKRQRERVLQRINLDRRRTSNASTPPRSLSPEKKARETAPSTDYKDVFPPARRDSIATLVTSLPLAQARRLSASTASPKDARSPMVPLTTPLEDCDSPTFTPTEFSVEDIKALGDFPDYAELSGVPLPTPYKEFDINQAIPRPYRPFRWAYHQTMALTKLEPDWWLELEKTYVSRIADRKRLYEQFGKMVLDYLPGSEFACKELMEISLQFLIARYPMHFSLSDDKLTFHNGLLHNSTDLKSMHPLLVLLENVPEDFAVMLRNPDNGFYYFRAGVICSSLGWNVATKLGKQLHEIHEPIPDYKEKMQFSMDRYFSKMPTDRPIQRGSWGLEVDTPLFMPPGDPHEAHRDTQSPDLPLSRVHLRVDWQTLRRLPLSAAIIFNFKALFTPVEAFRDEPYVPALCQRVLTGGKRSLMEYKNTWHVEHVVLPALEEWVQEQEKDGIVEEGWEVKTLDESPWFPGWEQKWRTEQGF
ncbi:MAG: Zn finger-containing GTPase- Activating Protein for ARF [Chaenotheca gracillima]|nr:MAG: Zn finger-containing GTPase- Activating Protein for ARF [Chaenotheca gracillima]